ncbi:F-box/kelch-repeat protein SKIP6-like [Magnolia sinica]|uniref:F-box/kelch-repeat protein SKIP6-like n=1 Tax=Magnolia sinica TaxID=86752 RepID=UPI0026587D5C|nr:F-box/kelch-repeat protein SKIP6-like [Magnolia sinica]
MSEETDSDHSPVNTSPCGTLPPLIPNLPDDISLQCIARVPRSFHPNLSLVSRSFHSLLRSPLFYTVRSHLNISQHFLYITIRTPRPSSSFLYFYLDPNSPKRRLVPLPPPPIPAIGSSSAVLGPRLFLLGGSVNEIPTARVWIFDARFNRWEPGPRMRIAREFSAAGVVDGKIYVLGGCPVDSWARSTSWAEAFDPAVGSWAGVPSPADVQAKWMHGNAVLDGKVYAMADRGGMVFDPVAGTWCSVSKRLDLGWRGRAAVVDGILYCYDYLGKIRGYDGKEDKWKQLKGVDSELPSFLCGAALANAGGRLCVIWEGKRKGKEMEIWSAEINVFKDSGGGLSGVVLWSEVVMAVLSESSVVNCVAVGL